MMRTEIVDDFLTFITNSCDIPDTDVNAYEPTETFDDLRAITQTWMAVAWNGGVPLFFGCRFRPLSEKEGEEYGREGVIATHAMWCYFNENITEKCEIRLWGTNRRFDILSLLNWMEQDIILKIILREVV